VSLTYVGAGGGDGGDQYTGLDRFGRVVDQRWVNGSGQDIDRYQYGYDPNGNRLYRDNVLNDALDELYHANGPAASYDPLNQMVEYRRGPLSDTNLDGIPDTVANASFSQVWAPDAAGNFDGPAAVTTTVGGASSPQARTHDAQNRVTSVGGTGLLHDANGNLTQDQDGRTLVWDAWNRLAAIQSGGTPLVSYAYDALSRRVSETRSGVTTSLYYSADGQMLEEQVGGAMAARYVWSPLEADVLVLRQVPEAEGFLAAASARQWALQDANGNVTGLTGDLGAVQERYSYTAYGQAAVWDGSWNGRTSSNFDWRYYHQGLRRETVAEYDHAWFRVYSPSLMRFVSQDPIGFAGGDPNLYRAYGNDPATYTDPSGLQSRDYYGPGGTKSFWDVMFDLRGWWAFLTGNRTLPGGGTEALPGASTGLRAIATDTVIALPPLRAGAAFGAGYDTIHQGLGNVTDWRRGNSLRGFDVSELQDMTIAGGSLGWLAKFRAGRAGFGLLGLGTGAEELRRGDYEQGGFDLLMGGLGLYSTRPAPVPKSASGQFVIRSFEGLSRSEKLLAEIGGGIVDASGRRVVVMVGGAQVTQNPAHAATAARIAGRLAQGGRYRLVAMDEPINLWTGANVHPNIKADVMGIRWDGRVDLIEVFSPPGQTRASQISKLRNAMNQLPERMRGEFDAIPPTRVAP
jgi:RHS repeat-associated protein